MRSNFRWVVLTVMASISAGCQSSAPLPTTTLPLAGQTVEILAPADLALRETWEPLLQEWQAETGGATKWSEYDPANPPWKDGKALGDRLNGGRVVLVPLAELSDVDAAGLTTSFPSEVVDIVDGKDIFPGLKEWVLNRQRKLVAAPVSAPVLLCYYRKDLLDAAGRMPPRTWEEYQQLIDELPHWAPGLSAVEPCGPDFRASLFLARSTAFCKHPQNYSVWFDIQTGEPLFDTPGFERALDTARQAWSKMPAEIWTMTPADCRQKILSGKAALVLAYEPASSYPRSAPSTEDKASSSDTARDPLPVGVVPLPGSNAVYHRDAKRWDTLDEQSPNQPGFTGFTGMVLGASAGESQAAAWNLLQMLTKHQDQAFAEQPRSPCRESDVMSPSIDEGQTSLETASLIVDAMAETLRRRDVVCDLAIPRADDVRRILATELESVKENSRTTQEILATIQERIAAATKDRRESLRDGYRRSLGLPALK